MGTLAPGVARKERTAPQMVNAEFLKRVPTL
jgi:hypothetical protein